MVSEIYEIGKEYLDKGNPKLPGDQFSKWINISGTSSMSNGPGIRWLNFKDKKKLPAAVILITKNASSAYHNPWHDIINLMDGEIIYWGDAKAHSSRGYQEFPGNKMLQRIYETILEGDMSMVPPILHFSKPKRGLVVFNGVCVIDSLEIDWFEDKGKPVKNFRVVLSVLNIPEVNVNWLHSRVLEDFTQSPSTWSDYVTGRKIDVFKVWKKHILSKSDQLPEVNSFEYEVLEKINSLSPERFEKFTVDLITRIKNIRHKITKTRHVKDKGFDFFGSFTLSYPLHYTIRVKGEAKKYSPNTAVGPKDISRLAAKLERGEYGIFITTSYYSTQAQEELFEDNYPIRLLSGNDVINFLREYKLISKSTLTEALKEMLS